MKKISTKITPFIIRFGPIVIVLTLWEVLGRSGLISPIILCPFSALASALFDNYAKYFHHLKITSIEISLALLIAWILGLICGVVIGGIKILRDIFAPLLSSFYAVPLVVIYPVLAAWLGLGMEAKYIFGGLYGFFPVLLNTVAGIRSIDPQYEVLAKSIGASKLQTIIQVKVPLSLPEILAGIRLGAALSVIGVVVAEMLASAAGLGYLIEFNRTIFNTPNVYLAILIVLIIVGIIDRILYTIENRFIYWSV
jgi:NitT/TauT family transport system permease protein/taurine transport system permease protein